MNPLNPVTLVELCSTEYLHVHVLVSLILIFHAEILINMHLF